MRVNELSVWRSSTWASVGSPVLLVTTDVRKGCRGGKTDSALGNGY